MKSTSAERVSRSTVHAETWRVMWVVLVLNVAVAAAKLVYGASAHVVALQADGLHSLLDAFANVVGLVGLHFSTEPPDSEHPYGHRRIEHLAAAGVGILILFGVVEVGRGAWDAFFLGDVPRTEFAGLAVILGTLVVNIGVTRWEHKKGQALGSPFLEADAMHTLSDVFATLLVLASYAAAHARIRWADPVAAAAVMLLIARTGYHVLRDNVPVLLDAAVIDSARVRAVVRTVPGVAGCHRIRSRGSPRAVHLDLHIQVDPQITVLEGHRVSHAVKDAIHQQLPEVEEVLVHIEPDVDEERYE